MTSSDSKKPRNSSFLDQDKIAQGSGVKQDGKAQDDLIPAATVVLVKKSDAPEGIKVLMLRRNSKLNFAGGQWVFPGGRIDNQEISDNSTLESAARVAAVRETQEETGLIIREDELAEFARWTAPPAAKKRFDTWFYITECSTALDTDVAIDGGEIHEYRWMTPKQVLAERDSKVIEILPPTFVTLTELSQFSSVSSALTFYNQRPTMHVLPKTHLVGDEIMMLYPGDSGYNENDPNITSQPQHRFIMGAEDWAYINTMSDSLFNR